MNKKYEAWKFYALFMSILKIILSLWFKIRIVNIYTMEYYWALKNNEFE